MATYTNQQIADYIKSIQAQGGGNAQIVAEMDRLGVTPAQVAAATNTPVSQIQAEYNRINPSGTYSTTRSTTTNTTAGITDQQIADYIRNIQQTGGTNADIARAMDEFDISPSRVATVTNVPVANIQSEYNKVSPRGEYATTSTVSTPTTGFNNQQIADYIKDIQARGGSNADIARAMDQFKVSPAQVSAALGVSTTEVQNLYNQYNPKGAYSTVTTTPPTTTPPTTTPPTTPTGSYTSQQIFDYIKDIQARGGSYAEIAAAMDQFKVNPSQVASALNMSATEVQNLYNQYNPKGAYSTVTTTPPTTPPTTFTPAQIADYVKQMQSLGKTNAEIAAEMDKFGVNVDQMAAALGVSPIVIQDLYNVASPRGKYSTVLRKEGIAGFERPTYEPVQFTGRTNLGIPAAIPTAATAPMLGGRAPGSPIGLGSIAGVAAPDVYTGVPAAPPRPAANYPAPTGFSPEEIGNYINMMEGAGATTTDINTVLGGLTPAQREAGETAAIVQDAPATKLRGGGLAGLAQKVQSAGRNGDTMLAHITPKEAGILQLMGGSGTINPQTGLPEFFSLRDIGRGLERGVRSLGRSIDRRITQPILGELNNLAERLGPIGQLAAMYFSPVAAGIYAGFAAPGDDFNFKKAAQTAALTYAGKEILPSLGGSPTGGANPMSAADYGAAVDSIDAAAGATLTPPPPGPGAVISSADPNVISYTPDPASYVGGAPAIEQTAMLDQPTMTDAGPGAAPSITSQVEEANKAYEAGRPFTDKAADYLSNLGSRAVDYAIDNPFKTAIAATMGTSLVQGQREREKFKEEQARVGREMEERRRRYREQAEGILSLYPIRFAAQGGMMDEPDEGKEYDFAGGGMPPRFLSGGGDGMSDSIPATIGDKQPARLADGEFVIPADVVSGLGNGSSKAGAKQLYAMMDRIRKARTGTTKQGREINPRRFMPA